MMSFEQLDLDQIQDVAQAKRAIVGLLNLVEDLQATVRELQGDVQRLRDEINRLKGEQGKPDIKPNRRGKQPGPGTDHSSEAERRKPQAWQKGSKLAKVKIDREEVLTVDPAQLPADAEFKGYGKRSHLASAETNLSTHIRDILNVLTYEDLTDVILVGHSYSGMVITGVADSVPERISKLVYLDAFVPEDGQSLAAVFRPSSSQAASPQVPLLDGWRVPYPYRERPFGITAENDVQWVLDKITPQPINTLTEPKGIDAQKRTR